MAVQIDAKEHWAFLEEIEAPMWVDLNLEAESSSNEFNMYESWFYSDHQFHICSSRQLKAAFAHPREHSGSPAVKPKSCLSPKLPSSVSRSRGKEYAIKRWKAQEQSSMLKSQTLVKMFNKMPSDLDPTSKFQIKSTRSFANGILKVDKNSVSKGIALGSSNGNMSCRRQPRQTNVERSSGTPASPVELLSSSRVILGKSCDKRLALMHRKSSSGKSSVGSSSSLLVSSGNKKGKTPDKGSVGNEAEACTNQCKLLKVVKFAQLPNKTAGLMPRRPTLDNVSKKICGSYVNAKVPKRAKALDAREANRQVSSSSAVVRDVRSGKENLAGSTTLVQMNKKDNPSVSRLQQARKGDKARLVGPQGSRDQLKGATQRPHFR